MRVASGEQPWVDLLAAELADEWAVLKAVTMVFLKESLWVAR